MAKITPTEAARRNKLRKGKTDWNKLTLALQECMRELNRVRPKQPPQEEQGRLDKLSAISILEEIRDREICWYPAHREVADAFNDNEKAAFNTAIESLKEGITSE